MAREAGLPRLGTVAIDGTKLDANASKIRSVRYDQATELRVKLAAGDRRSAAGHIAELTGRADAGFASGPAVAALAARGIEPLVAIGRTQPHRPYDFPRDRTRRMRHRDDQGGTGQTAA
jgi:hypothetical protein